MALKSIAAAGLVLCALSIPALADSGTATTTAPNTKTAADPNKVICRKIEVIGSRLDSKRICRTKAEWDSEQAANRQDLDRRQTLRDRNGGG